MFVYAPIGPALRGTSLLPELIAKGKGHVAVARVMGKFAINQVQKSATTATAKLEDQAAGVIDFLGESVTPLPANRRHPRGPVGSTGFRQGRGEGDRGGGQQRQRREPGDPGLRRPLRFTGREPPRRPLTGGARERPAATRRPIAAARRSCRRSRSSRVADGPAPEEGTRPATDEDVARLAELAGAAVEELRQGRGGQVWARQAARRSPFEPELRAQVDDPTHRVLVGTVDDVVMGYAVARTDLLPDGGRLGVVDRSLHEPGRGSSASVRR